MQHKHAEVAHAYIDGKECEYWSHWDKRWQPISAISYFNNLEIKVRIKPVPKPNVVAFAKVYSYENFIAYIGLAHPEQDDMDNLKLTWDGETGNLKLAEVI
jgi:hypothetical protein